MEQVIDAMTKSKTDSFFNIRTNFEREITGKEKIKDKTNSIP